MNCPSCQEEMSRLPGVLTVSWHCRDCNERITEARRIFA